MAQEIQDYISNWAETTFKHDQKGIAAHLLSEAVELYLASGGTPEDALMIAADIPARKLTASGWPSIPEETADVMILAYTMAGYIGFSADKEIWDKMAKNVKRVWGQPNAHGYTEHLDITGKQMRDPDDQMEYLGS